MIPDLDYAFYVWTSYGVFAAAVVWHAVQPLARRARILAEIQEERALETGGYDDPDA